MIWQALQFGPNGGLVYCMEYLINNMDVSSGRGVVIVVVVVGALIVAGLECGNVVVARCARCLILSCLLDVGQSFHPFGASCSFIMTD
jgi:hypothetical protein